MRTCLATLFLLLLSFGASAQRRYLEVEVTDSVHLKVQSITALVQVQLLGTFGSIFTDADGWTSDPPLASEVSTLALIREIDHERYSKRLDSLHAIMIADLTAFLSANGWAYERFNDPQAPHPAYSESGIHFRVPQLNLHAYGELKRYTSERYGLVSNIESVIIDDEAEMEIALWKKLAQKARSKGAQVALANGGQMGALLSIEETATNVLKWSARKSEFVVFGGVDPGRVLEPSGNLWNLRVRTASARYRFALR